MIGDIKDLFKPISQRLSTPLFSSFIISWLIVNWRVIIGLIFFNKEDLQKEGYTSFIKFIEFYISQPGSLLWPIFGSIFYTFFFPFVRIGISAMYQYVKKISSIWNFRISKDGSVSVEQYLKHVQNYDSLKIQLQETIKQEGQYRVQNEKLSLENAKLESNAVHLVEELSHLKNDSKISKLYGEWRYYDNLIRSMSDFITVVIDKKEIFYIEERTRRKFLLYTIIDIISNPQTQSFAMVLKPANIKVIQQPGESVQVLTFADDFQTMEGNENNRFPIRYTKLPMVLGIPIAQNQISQ